MNFVLSEIAVGNEGQRFKQRYPEFFPTGKATNRPRNVQDNRETIDEAIQKLEETLKHHPDSFLDHNELGRLYEQKQRFKEAMAHFMKARSLHPDHPDAPLGIAQMLIHMERKEKAAQLLRSMQKRFKNSGIEGRIASLLKQIGQ